MSARIEYEHLAKEAASLRLLVYSVESDIQSRVGGSDLLHRLGECRASVNRMLATLTHPEPGDGKAPAWKEQAARLGHGEAG